MRPIESAINTESDEYKANHAAMVEHCDTLRERLAMATEQGKPAAIKKHLDRFQMLGALRTIDLLILDEGSPYLELMSLAGWEQDDMTLGGSSVIGIGLVEGVECLVSASVPTRAGGATNEVSVIKSLRAQEIARENRLPFINLVQSAGANLTQQSKVFNRGGASFRNIAQLSKLGVPSASIVFGNSTAGGAYIPGMSDFSVFVQRKAAVFLGGPPLVFAATGETTGEEELGGADMHARISGVADGMAIDEHHAIYLAREWVRGLSYTWERVDGWSYRHSVPNAWSIHRPPKFPADELLGIVSANPRVPYDAREVLLRIVDASELSEFKSLYGPNLVCAWAVIHGVAVGILTNNGVIFAPEARKAAQFIQLCNARYLFFFFFFV
ncbi:carboxyl transferase [Blastocladiella britannica]|nr:carboxyl transferase [Blastocladiella britannica]